VEALVGQEELRTDLRDMIRGVGDVMRIIQRFKGRRGTGRDAWDLALWVRSFERVLGRIKRDSGVEGAGGRLETFIQSVKPIADLAELVEGTIDEAAVMKQGLNEGDDDEGDMELQAGDAMLAGSQARKGESKKQRIEREKAENDVNQWWMKPQ
jgi:DNA mismatch repair ATPase MutS